MFRLLGLISTLSLCPTLCISAEPGKYGAELKAITSITREGTGNDAASAAWAKVVAGGADALLPILKTFDGATPQAANWLRTAVDAIVEGEKKTKRPLNVETLTTFLNDSKNQHDARRIAYELIDSQDKAAAAKLIKTFTNDPSLELRRDAIAANLEELKKHTDVKPEPLKALFASARDKDQIEAIAKDLDGKGVKMNITKHLGYITEWHAVGPFDNAKSEGFNKDCEPEKKVDLEAKYPGSHNESKKSWTYTKSSATYGTIDLNEALGKHKDATAYATATIVTEKEIPCEIRIASQNAIKIFVNGKEVFARDEYHHGTRMDQHTARITLVKGKNTILLKVLQNDMPYAWAQAWAFAARICDATGGALPVKQELTLESKTSVVELGELKPAPKKKEKD